MKARFEVCAREWESIREQMIALQEELDWECYRLYGLIDEDLTFLGSRVGQPPSAVTSRTPAVPSRTPPRAKPMLAESRRKLPHLQAEGKTYAITFCSKDRWVLPESVRERVLQHCLHDHGVKLSLHAAVVMPDHVHLLLTPRTDPDGNPYGLSEIMSGIKGASAHSINRMLHRKGPVWQDESFDHMLRSEDSIEAQVAYLSQNPVRKGLVAQPEEYPWLWREGLEGRNTGEMTGVTAGGGCPTIGSGEVTAEGGCPTIGLKLGERAFEIALARKMVAGECQTTWFERHGSTPIVEIPKEWPQDYQDLVRRRMEVIATNPNIALIEQPEYKRRWNTEPWASQRARALRSWLLDRLESFLDFDGRMNEEHGVATARLPIGLVSVGRLADVARQDPTFLEVGALSRDDPAFDVSRLVAELVEAESVPLLPILRYKPSGLRKREAWEATWTLQRKEDALDARTTLPRDHPEFLTELDAIAQKKLQVGTIPVPPKYTSADFLKGDFWRLRGKLDVPKERWVSFPHCEGEDGSLMVAWAGYDHLQLARAISAYYVDVQERLGGRDDPRLVPLLACLVELLPWLKQWHNDVDPEFGLPMGDYFEGFAQEESRNLGLTLDEVRAWQPPSRGPGRCGRSRTT